MIPAIKGQRSTGVDRSSGKLVLISAAYQIFAVGVISGSLMAQAPDVGSGVCVMYHGTPPPSTRGGGGYRPPSGPSPAEIAVQQQRQDAQNLNEQGLQYWKNGRWKLAMDAFKAALDKWPDNEMIRQNLKAASDKVADEEAQRKREQQAEFERSKNEALSSMKGIADSEFGGLKGISTSDDFGFKSVGETKTSNLGLKEIGNTKTLFEKGTRDSAPVDTRATGPSKLDVGTSHVTLPIVEPMRGNTEPKTPTPQAGLPEDLVKEFLFPGKSSVFPENPDKPLLNPLIEQAKAKNLPVPGETADAFYARFQKSDLFTKLDQEDNSLHPWDNGTAYPRGKYPAVDKTVDETLKGIQEHETSGLQAACQNAVKQMNAEYASMEQQGIIHPGDDLAAKEKNDAAYQQALMHARHRVYEQFQKDVQVTLIQHDTALDKLKLDIPKLQEANQSDVEKYLFPANKQ